MKRKTLYFILGALGLGLFCSGIAYQISRKLIAAQKETRVEASERGAESSGKSNNRVLDVVANEVVDFKENIADLKEKVTSFEAKNNYNENKDKSFEAILANTARENRENAERRQALLEKASTPQDDALELERRIKRQRELLKKRIALRKMKKSVNRRTVVTGPIYPFKLLLSPGWKILESQNVLVLSWNDEVTVTVETGPWVATHQEYARKVLEDVSDSYPTMEIEETELVDMGYQKWLKYVFQEKTEYENAENPRELMVLTHGGYQGSYYIVIGGLSEALDRQVGELNKLLQSFRFPPDNYKPENVNEVRVYVDGVRQFF